MELCDNDCIACCDFCVHFTRYVAEYDEESGEPIAYTGEGYCDIKKEVVNIDGECDSFRCFNVDSVDYKLQPTHHTNRNDVDNLTMK